MQGKKIKPLIAEKQKNIVINFYKNKMILHSMAF